MKARAPAASSSGTAPNGSWSPTGISRTTRSSSRWSMRRPRSTPTRRSLRFATARRTADPLPALSRHLPPYEGGRLEKRRRLLPFTSPVLRGRWPVGPEGEGDAKESEQEKITMPAPLPQTAPTNVLDVASIEVIYNHVILVLKGVSLSVPEGGIVALLGGNGAGKSTTLKAISNLLRTERGEVTKGAIE